LHIRPFWIHLKTRIGSIHTLRRPSDFDMSNEVLHLDSDQSSTTTGLAHDLTGGQALY
jgi:hypothetical protein